MKFLIDGIEVEGELTEIVFAAPTDEERAAHTQPFSIGLRLVPAVRVFSLMLTEEYCGFNATQLKGGKK